MLDHCVRCFEIVLGYRFSRFPRFPRFLVLFSLRLYIFLEAPIDFGLSLLFRRIRRGDHIHNERLTAHSARRIIKKRAAAAGIEGFISGQSLRVGSAVSLAKAGASVVNMQVAGRWKSAQMPAHYAKAELAERGAIARFKESRTAPQ